MNKKFFVAWIVVFIAWFLGGFLIHGTLLKADYAQLAGMFRSDPEMMSNFPLMILAYAIMSGAFVWIYARGVEAKPAVGQGLRFGLAVALVMSVPMYMITYVVAPYPGMLVVKQVVMDTILLLILGVIVASLYKAPSQG